MLLPAHTSSPGSPISTKPVAPETRTNPPTSEPQSVNPDGFLALMLPVMVEFVMATLAPGLTLTAPFTVAFEMQVLPLVTVTERTVPETVCVQVLTAMSSRNQNEGSF